MTLDAPNQNKVWRSNFRGLPMSHPFLDAARLDRLRRHRVQLPEQHVPHDQEGDAEQRQGGHHCRSTCYATPPDLLGMM